MDKKISAIISLSLILVLLYLPWLNLKSLSTRGEAREAIVAQSMVVEGDWILPRGYNNVVPSKPPFMHWIIAGLSSIEGALSPLTARLPSAALSILLLTILYLFLQKRIGSDRAILTSILLLSCVEWSRSSLTCRVDMTLSVMLFLGMLSLYSWAERGLTGYPFAAPLLFAAATLTKGPVAVVLPGVIWGGYLLLRGRSLLVVIDTGVRIFLPALALASLWYLAAFDRGGQAFFDKFWSENFERFTGTMEDNPHEHSAVYLIGTLFVGLIPWSFYLIPAIFKGVITPAQTFKNLKAAIVRLPQSVRAMDSLQLFAWIGALGFLIFYSIPLSKRSVYLLPAYPWYALLLAQYLIGLKNERIVHWVERAVLFIVGAASLLTLLALFIRSIVEAAPGSNINMAILWEVFGEGLTPANLTLLACVILAAALCGVLLDRLMRSSAPLAPYRKVAAFQVGVLILLNGYLLPLTDYNSDPNRFAEQIRPFLIGLPLYAYNNQMFGLDLALEQRILDLEDPPLNTPALVLALERDYDSLAQLITPRSLELLAAPNIPIEKPGRGMRLFKIQ